jgi:hypothetical protein
MQIRDRIRELRRVPAGQLRPHPKNWRTHPKAQREALQGLLAEVGYADALLARELPDGTLQLIDGHLRAETTPDAEVPVLVLDVSEAEADKMLLTLDPLAAMAQADAKHLHALLQGIHTENEAVAGLLEQLAQEHGLLQALATDNHAAPAPAEAPPPERWGVYVECADEAQQKDLLERLHAEGLTCRGLSL